MAFNKGGTTFSIIALALREFSQASQFITGKQVCRRLVTVDANTLPLPQVVLPFANGHAFFNGLPEGSGTPIGQLAQLSGKSLPIGQWSSRNR